MLFKEKRHSGPVLHRDKLQPESRVPGENRDPVFEMVPRLSSGQVLKNMLLNHNKIFFGNKALDKKGIKGFILKYCPI
jgi:hypothetical protein